MTHSPPTPMPVKKPVISHEASCDAAACLCTRLCGSLLFYTLTTGDSEDVAMSGLVARPLP